MPAGSRESHRFAAFEADSHVFEHAGLPIPKVPNGAIRQAYTPVKGFAGARHSGFIGRLLSL